MKKQKLLFNFCLVGLIFLLQYPQDAMAENNKLCEAAHDVRNYNDDFLDNFITLKDGKNGWLFKDVDLRYRFGPSEQGYRRLRFITKLLRIHGTRLLMVPIPTRGISQPNELGDIDYDVDAGRNAYKKHLAQLRKIGMIVPELDKLFTQEHDSPLFFSRDHHWTSYGAKRVAQLVAAEIKKQDFYKNIEKVNFTTVRNDVINMEGSHQKAAQIICGTQYPEEKIPGYNTVMDDEAVDLFSDNAEPEVILVGTSNSKAVLNFNFAGFLKDYTSIDILNLAESGGGFDKAIMNYVKSDSFRSNPPKLLIWEVPSYYSLNSIDFYKSMVRTLKQLPKNAEQSS